MRKATTTTVAAVIFVAGVAGGFLVERYMTGAVDVIMSREIDGVRCNVELSRYDGEWWIQSLAVVPDEPEPCAPDWVHCHDGSGPGGIVVCDYGKICDHCPGCVVVANP